MDDFVDALSIDELDQAEPENTYNPAIQQFNNVVIQRV